MLYSVPTALSTYCNCDHAHCNCDHTHCNCDHKHCNCDHAHCNCDHTHCNCDHTHCNCDHTHCNCDDIHCNWDSIYCHSCSCLYALAGKIKMVTYDVILTDMALSLCPCWQNKLIYLYFIFRSWYAANAQDVLVHFHVYVTIVIGRLSSLSVYVMIVVI